MRKKYRIITAYQHFDTNSRATALAIAKRQHTTNVFVWRNGTYEPFDSETTDV